MAAMAWNVSGSVGSSLKLQETSAPASISRVECCCRSTFWGGGVLEERSKVEWLRYKLRTAKDNPQLPMPMAKIKRRKDPQLDEVIERDKKVRLVTKMKELLVKQEGRVMSLKQLGLHRRTLGLRGRRRCIVLLRRFPAVFEVHDEGAGQVWFRFTRAAEEQYLKETLLRERMESILVDKVRKLLMMATEKQLLVQKLTHLRRDLGLPQDFATNMLRNYPQYFRLKSTVEGPMLELTSWDPCLAVSALEHQAAKEAAKLKEQSEATFVGQGLGKQSDFGPAVDGLQLVEDDEEYTSEDESEWLEQRISDAEAIERLGFRSPFRSPIDVTDGEHRLLANGDAEGNSRLVEDGAQGSVELNGEEAAMAAIARGKAAVGAGTFGTSTDPDRHARKKRVNLNFPPGYSVSRKDLKRLQAFLDLPFVSPYSDASEVHPASKEAEKRSVAVLHEMLSLTLEKRLLCDHFTHFRRDYRLSQRLRGMIIRHPELFYVSEKGMRDSVFLREAYNGLTLVKKDPLVQVTDELRQLVWLGKKTQKIRSRGEGDEDEDDDNEDYSEDDEDDDDDDDDDDYEDDDDDDGWGESDDEEEISRDEDRPPRGYARGARTYPPVQGRVLQVGRQKVPASTWRRPQPEKQEAVGAPPKERW